ncbi:unnamed protein product [Periconia digitata]|uniref:Uncharacterized protein n=1 Tax=Periconia digitata TaxID=1303443 RepID=A0A9W4ULF7_9PLEO|nr:unnamed protein product [Periconia digitata]
MSRPLDNACMTWGTGEKYDGAPIHVSTLIGQLFIIQTALDKLSDWNQARETRHPRYQQLAAQVGNALDCFGTLISTLQKQLDQFETSNSVEMPTKNKIKFIWSEKEIANYSTLLDRQVNALTLLLQAVQCETWEQQRELLSREESVSILILAKDCSSSVLGLDDGHSFLSETTANISVTFDFDTFVLGSRVYQQAERSHLRQAIRAEQSRKVPAKQKDNAAGREDALILQSSSGDASKQAVRSRNSFRLTDWFRNSSRRKDSVTSFTAPKEGENGERSHGFKTVKVLFLGTSESGKSTLIKTLQLSKFREEYFSYGPRLLFKEIIRSNIIQSTRIVLEAMDSLAISLEDPFRNNIHAETIFMQLAGRDSDCSGVKTFQAIVSLWQDSGFQISFGRRREYQLDDNFDYYANNIKRIMASDYMPTDEDILRIRVTTTGISATKLLNKKIEYEILDVGGARSERKKWNSVIGGTHVVTLTIDVRCYANVLLEDETCNRMQEQLVLFDSIVNSKWFSESSFLVVFTKLDCLADSLRTHRVERYLPDYVKDESLGPVESYMQYIEHRFMGLVRSHSIRYRTRIVRADLVGDAYKRGLEVWNTLDDIVRNELK